MENDFCCHGNCHQSDNCPRRQIETPGDTRMGFILICAVSAAVWAVLWWALA